MNFNRRPQQQSTRDLYADLEIPKSASTEEIKKAYRKQAIKHHPDRGGDAEVFKKVTEANEMLSDETTRQIYDQHGYDGLKEYQNQVSQSNDMRVQFQPLVVKVVVNLAELYQGCKRSIEIERIVFEGNIRVPHMLKKTPEKETYEIEIEPMTVYGDKIVKAGLGNRHKTEETIGDLIFIIVPDEATDSQSNQTNKPSKEGQYKGFTLSGLDLHYLCQLTLAEALLGFKKRIEFLDGKQIMLSSNKITQPETVKVIEKMGFQKMLRTPFGNMPKQGHLYVHFEIEFPTQLDDKTQKLVAKTFGVPKLDKADADHPVVDYKVDQLVNPDQLKPEMQEGHGPMIIGPDGVPIQLPGGMDGAQECTIM